VTVSRILGLSIAVGLLAVGVARSRDPRRTALPFGTTDLSSVQSKLDALPDSERALVVAYVKRSRGDVLPPKFADPDDPLTARTFGEAIDLQRRLLARQAEVDAKVAVRDREREAALQPLRAALEVEIVDRAIMPRGRALLAPGMEERVSVDGRGALQAIDDVPVVVTTYRLRNAASLAIDSVTGNVAIMPVGTRRSHLEALAMCWIDNKGTLAPGQSTEIRCSNLNRTASARDSAYVAMSPDEIELEWTPKSIAFGDGTSLTYSGD